jgi:hypothetical protein
MSGMTVKIVYWIVYLLFIVQFHAAICILDCMGDWFCNHTKGCCNDCCLFVSLSAQQKTVYSTRDVCSKHLLLPRLAVDY